VTGIGGQLTLVAFLIVLNAAFAGTEIALISLREGQLARLETRSRAGRVLAELVRSPNRFLSTIQIGITLAGFLASATAAVALAEPLVEPLSFLGRFARPGAVLLITAGLTVLTLVLGELAPKRLAMQRAEAWALVAARPLAVLAKAASPVVWFLSHATDITVRVLGGDPRRDRQEVTDEEIRDLVAAHRSYTPAQRQIIAGALEVADRSLREIVVPRRRVVAVSADTPVEDALGELAAVGHSRAPVYTEDLDDAETTISVLGLIGRDGVVGEHAHPVLALPESLDAVSALRELQLNHQQLALVVSEHGGVEGIVTVEDLVEELVGEIYDEHDRDVQAVLAGEDGTYVVPGSFPLHDLEDLGLTATAEDATTVGGLVVEQLGRLARPGDRVEVGDLHLEVLAVRRRAVEQVRLEPPPHRPPASAG
jgi:putative hemolysin